MWGRPEIAVSAGEDARKWLSPSLFADGLENNQGVV